MNNIVISIDETHHLSDGKPLYHQRFDKVQSFHFDYAPVIKNKYAFFINRSGESVFDRQFLNAFGFYDGIATVADKDGFFHINKQGENIHSQHFFWSGNFQENACTVQDRKTQHFFHINSQGQPLYKQQYTYVGDYRYGIAVITNNIGLCTHIDTQGNELHSQYFLELDVYHKSYAIAKDERGYFHINKKGQEIYKHRYLKIEPFYNNRAVAIDIYGVKKIISTQGVNYHTIDSNKIEQQKIGNYYANQSFSYWHSRILNSILELKVFDLLEENISLNDLYQKLNLPNKSIDMIIRWLVIQQLVICQNNTITLTLVGHIINKTIKPIIAYWQSREIVSTSLELTKSLKKHQKYFDTLYAQSFFEYVKNDKKINKNLACVMSYYALDYQIYLPYLNLSNEVVCDIGGGDGSLLTIVKEQYPKINPIILDKFTYTNNHSIKCVKGDIFQNWSAPADVYLMSRIFHDWDDKRVKEIIGQIVKNMGNTTILYIFETLVEDGLIDKGVTVSFHLLNILGGRERTLAEFTTLFRNSGLYIESVYQENTTISLMKIIKK